MSTPLSPIAYVLQLFPSITQTFLYREVEALRKLGVPIRVFSIFRPPLAERPAEAQHLMAETVYAFPISWPALIQAHLRYLLTRPYRYLSTLSFVLTRPGESLQNRRRTFVHFIYGVWMTREIERVGARHIHAHFGWSASTIALIAGRLLDVPFSVTFHSFHSEKAYPPHLLAKEKIRLARFVVAISEYHRRFMASLFPEGGAADKIHVVHHGLNPADFTPAPDSRPRDGEFTILGVGQLIACKGFHILVEACSLLAARGVPFRCIIFGQGPERSRLEHLVDQYGLREQVTLPGWIDQLKLRALLNQVDVFALPCLQDESGRQDGLPVVLTEAMAMELPVISTRIAAIPELIAHEQNGLLTAPGDVAALADALQRLKDDPDLRRRLGRAARQTVLAEFDIHHSAEQLAELFRGC